MACKTLRSPLLMLIGLIAPGLVYGQSESISARNILKQSRADQIAFLESTVDQGFPEDRADQVAMLVINRSEIAVPVLLQKVEDALNSQTAPERLVNLAVEVIAYAGDEEAIRAFARLISTDDKRFAPYIGRTLNNAANWRNPFSIVYSALDISDSRIAGLAMKWVEAGMDSSGMQRKWAEAILERYGKVPATSDWAHDPIASRLKADRALNLKNRVLGVASDIQQDRNKIR